MNKVIYLLLFSAMTLFAGIDKMQQYYDVKNYKKVIKEARASKSEYSNPQLHLLWAKSAEVLGRLDEAMSAYERVIMLDEDNVEARVSLAAIYNQTNRLVLARETKKELDNYQLTPEQRLSLGIIKGEDIDKIKAQAKLSFGHDTNVNVSADDEKSTLFSRLSANASYINELGAKKAWYARADMKLYYQNNASAHYYDMSVVGLNVGAGYAGDGYSVYVPIGYSNIHYLDVNMLDQISLNPKVSFLLDELIINTNVKYSQRKYKQSENKNMDDTSFGLGAEAFYLMGKDFSYVNFSYENFSADNSGSTFIDRNMLTLSMGLNYNYSKDLITKFDYRYRRGSYDDDITSGGKKREDNYQQLEVKVSHYLKEKLELYVSERYVKNSSNNSETDYTKNIAMFGVSLNY